MDRPADVADGQMPADAIEAIWLERRREMAASESVYWTLREAILRKAMPSGTRLAEEEIGRRFNVSRTPVREAFLRIESEGLVHRVPRRGLVVSGISPEEILEVYVIRASLDGLAASLAAQTASRNQIAQLRLTNRSIQDAADAKDWLRMASLNLEFHAGLGRASHNRLLLQFIQQVHDRVRRFGGTTFAHGDRGQQVGPEHEHILDAIEARQGEEAEALARKHMMAAMEVRMDMLMTSGEDGGNEW
jgi:DNA-binding GntR family transcriptional regulator